MADKQYKLWMDRLTREKKAHEEFRKQAEKAERAARDDGNKSHEFNIHWANCKIVRSSIYGRRPKPDVRRRYKDPNREEKELARMVERAIEYQVDSNNFESPSQMVVKDFVEVGLGVPRVVYDVTTQPIEDPLVLAVAEEEGMDPPERIVAQTVEIEHIPWRHFRWEPGKAWEAVDWVAFESFRPRKEVQNEYGVKIKAGKEDDTQKRKAEEYADEIQLFEIWHRPTRKIIVLAASHPDILEEREDKLRLQRFWPIPRPVFSNLKSDELIPKPDYQFIEPQVVELNRLTGRIKSLTQQVRANGFYDAKIQGLQALKEQPDGTLKPITNLQAATEGNPDKAIQYLPFMEMVAAIRELETQRDAVKAQIFEIIGISDIVRGSSVASESATAQNLKGQWANVRLSEKTGDVARMWRDVYRIYAEIICEHFKPEILTLQTGIEVTPNMMQIMQSDIGRSFAIDIETDSTLAKDDYEERQQTMELIDTILARMEQVIPAVQSGLLPVDFVQQTLIMIISKHKNGKQLEDAVMELGPHLQSLQQFQQQMQSMTQQLQERDMALQHQGAQIEDMGKRLRSYNDREEMRKDAETRAKVEKEAADTEAQRIENRIVSTGLDVQEQAADIRKTNAETDQIRKETALTGLSYG